MLFLSASGGHWRPQMLSQTPKGADKGAKRATLGRLWGDFWVQSCSIGTLLKHCYLRIFSLICTLETHRCRPEDKLGPKSAHGCTLYRLFGSSLTHLVGSRSQPGCQSLPKGSQKAPQNRPKFTKIELRSLLVCWKVPGGTPLGA